MTSYLDLQWVSIKSYRCSLLWRNSAWALWSTPTSDAGASKLSCLLSNCMSALGNCQLTLPNIAGSYHSSDFTSVSRLVASVTSGSSTDSMRTGRCRMGSRGSRMDVAGSGTPGSGSAVVSSRVSWSVPSSLIDSGKSPANKLSVLLHKSLLLLLYGRHFIPCCTWNGLQFSPCCQHGRDAAFQMIDPPQKMQCFSHKHRN